MPHWEKRLQEAHDRGDVVKSQEVSTWFLMAGATLIIMAFSGAASNGIMTTLRGLIANSYDIPVEGPGFIAIITKLGREVIVATALPLFLLMLAALAGNLIQHRLVWSAEALTPKFSKISPAAGLGRLASKQTLANFAKGLAKLGLIGAVIGALLWPERFRLEGRIAALTSQGKLQGLIVAALPLCVGLFLDAYRPDLIAPMFETAYGYVLVGAVVLLQGTGFVLIRRIVAIDV